MSLALVCPLVAGLSASEQKPRRQRNRPPAIDSFTSSLTRIEIFPWGQTAALPKPEVELVVNATDPDADGLRYEYSTTEGTISGTGSLVLWDLRDVKRGPHEVRVTVTDGRGGFEPACVTTGSCTTKILW